VSKGEVSRLRNDLSHLRKASVKTPKRLTEDDRVVIAAMSNGGSRQSTIAKTIGFSASTISKELARNRGDDGRYRTETAQTKARSRKKRAPYKLCGWLLKCVEARIRRGERPYSIDLSLREKGFPGISPESIYRHVERDSAAGGVLWMFLAGKRSRRKPHRKHRIKHGPIPRRVDISKRPEEANNRERFGDWEGDTVHGAGPDGAAIVTLIDRKSRLLLMRKVTDLKSRTVAKVVEMMLAPFIRHTVTFDNGSEFAKHERMSRRLGCPCYFATPGCPGQRGSLEQSNGLIRQARPKKTTKFRYMRHSEVAFVQDMINGRRRKSLGGKRPADFLRELTKPA
jgi:IS30 family transposase